MVGKIAKKKFRPALMVWVVRVVQSSRVLYILHRVAGDFFSLLAKTQFVENAKQNSIRKNENSI